MKKIIEFFKDILFLILAVVLTIAFIPVFCVMLPFLIDYGDDKVK